MLWDGYWILEVLISWWILEDPSTGCFLAKRRIWVSLKEQFCRVAVGGFILIKADTMKGEWLKAWLGWRTAGSVSKMNLSCQVQTPQEQLCGEGCALLVSAVPHCHVPLDLGFGTSAPQGLSEPGTGSATAFAWHCPLSHLQPCCDLVGRLSQPPCTAHCWNPH